MGKSNEQIQREFNARSMPGQLALAADDLARLFANGVTGGTVNTDPEAINEARVRAGLAGDLAQVGGNVIGLKGAGGLLKAGYAGAKAVLPKVTMAGALKGVGLAGLLGWTASNRQDATPAAAVAKPKPAAAPAKPKPAAAAAQPITSQERRVENIDRILASPNATLRARQAAAGMLAQVSPKPVGTADAVMGEAALRMNAIHQQELKAAGNDPELGAKAMENDLARWLMLAGKGQQAMMLPPTIDGQE